MAVKEYNLQIKSLNKKLEDLDKKFEKIFTPTSEVVICWSGGKDSTFLLQYLNSKGYFPSILIFPHLFTKEQKIFISRMVKKHHWSLFYYSPEAVSVKEECILSLYSIGEKCFNLITDIESSTEECGLKLLEKIERHVRPVFMWDQVIFGTKESDEHRLATTLDFREDSGKETTYHVPLWDWEDSEILFALRHLKMDYNEKVYDDGEEVYNSGIFTACLKCKLHDGDVYCPAKKSTIVGVDIRKHG